MQAMNYTAVEALDEFARACARIGLYPFLFEDTLLGMQQGDPLGDRLTFGVLEEQTDKLVSLWNCPMLEPTQRLTSQRGIEEIGLRLSDVFFYVQVLRRNPSRAIPERYSIHRGGKRVNVYPSHHFVTMPSVEFFGQRIRVPSDWRMLLDWRYGDGDPPNRCIRDVYDGVL